MPEPVKRRRGVRAWVMWAAIIGVIVLVLIVVAYEIYRASQLPDPEPEPESAPQISVSLVEDRP